MSMANQDLKMSSSDVRTETDSMATKTNDDGIVLIPQPSDDPEDPLVREINTKRVILNVNRVLELAKV